MGEKTGENVGKSLGEIDELNLCQKSVTSLSVLLSNIHYWGCSKQCIADILPKANFKVFGM